MHNNAPFITISLQAESRNSSMKKIGRQYFQFFFVVALLVSLTGCFGGGEKLPELTNVTGTVTLDGKPLEKARVAFEPKEANEKGRGRTSIAYTDAAGKFVLKYNQDVNGAMLGKFSVSISKLSGTEEVPGDEMIPAKYNEKTTLEANVTSEGPNEFVFELKDSG